MIEPPTPSDSSLNGGVACRSNESVSTEGRVHSYTRVVGQNISHSVSNQVTVAGESTTSRSADYQNRKLNVLVFGIAERNRGTHYTQRFVSDLDNISTLLQKS